MVAELSSGGAMMLQGLAWRLTAALLMALTLEPTYEIKEHLMMEGNQCLLMHFPTFEMSCGDSRGNNSRTLDLDAGMYQLAIGSWTSQAAETWWWSSANLVQVHGEERWMVQVPPEEKRDSFAISACDVSVSPVVRGPVTKDAEMELHLTLKEFGGACMEAAELAAGWMRTTSCGNQCFGDVAVMNVSPYEIGYMQTEPNTEVYAGGGMAMMNMPYFVQFVNVLDKLDEIFEKMFLYVENYDIKLEFTSWMDFFVLILKQLYGMVTLNHLWMSWLITMCFLLAMSHLGLWKWMHVLLQR